MSAHETVSEKWLKSAQSAVNADPSFRKRGSIDVKMAVKSDKSIYLVTFGGFSCHDVRTITDAGVRDACLHVDAEALQVLRDQFTRARLPVRELGIPVHVLELRDARTRELVGERRDLGVGRAGRKRGPGDQQAGAGRDRRSCVRHGNPPETSILRTTVPRCRGKT